MINIIQAFKDIVNDLKHGWTIRNTTSGRIVYHNGKEIK